MTWPEYCDQARELFRSDPDVRVEADDGRRILTFYVRGEDRVKRIKFLRAFLPDIINFGTVNAQIKIKVEGQE